MFFSTSTITHENCVAIFLIISEIQFRIDHNTVVPSKDIFMMSNSFEKLETVTVMGTRVRQRLLCCMHACNRSIDCTRIETHTINH